jgi:hypothetical protein
VSGPPGLLAVPEVQPLHRLLRGLMGGEARPGDAVAPPPSRAASRPRYPGRAWPSGRHLVTSPPWKLAMRCTPGRDVPRA